MLMPTEAALKTVPRGAWPDRFGRAQNKLRLALRNTRHIEQLLREPRTLGPDAAASLVRTVNLIVESRCNIVCSCCHYFKTRKPAASDRQFDLPRLLALVDEVPNADVGITGGEPLMSPERVVEAARALLARNRDTAVVTNSLPLAEPRRGEPTRAVLLAGLTPAERARLRIRCSIDLQHRAGSDLPLDEYVRRCHAAVRFLVSGGFPVYTRSIVTTREEYEFFRNHVLPLTTEGVTRGASLQPDMYGLAGFVAGLDREELGDTPARIGSSYLQAIRDHLARAAGAEPSPARADLRTAPWALIEINARGVRGPSGFFPTGTHHASVLEMLRSYDWLHVSDTIVPQITISQNAFLYRLDRRSRSVTLNVPYLLGKILRR